MGIRTLSALTLALALPCAVLAAEVPGSKANRHAAATVVVRAKEQTSTWAGVTVRRGQRLLVEAAGTWCMGGVPPTAECGGPEGIRPANPVELPLILNSAQIGTLLGRIGNGPWFAIGRRELGTAPSNGPLLLLFNDRPCCYGDNSRSIEVTVRRVEDD
jgi:hypothetical protein